MLAKNIVFTACLAAFFLVTTQAVAGEGEIAIRLRQDRGQARNGEVTATNGKVTRKCKTRAARCTIKGIPEGEWTVFAVTKAGKKTPKRKITVKSGRQASLSLTFIETKKNDSKPGEKSPKKTKKLLSKSKGSEEKSAGKPAKGSSESTKRAASAAAKAAKSGAAIKPSRTSKSLKTDKTRVDGSDVSPPKPGTRTRVPSTGAKAAKTSSSVKPEPKDLSKGKTRSVTGSIRDADGRALIGKVTVKQGDKVIGTTRTAAGRFTIYDLPTGAYTVHVETKSGKKATRAVKSVKDKVVSVNLKVE